MREGISRKYLGSNVPVSIDEQAKLEMLEPGYVLGRDHVDPTSLVKGFPPQSIHDTPHSPLHIGIHRTPETVQKGL